MLIPTDTERMAIYIWKMRKLKSKANTMSLLFCEHRVYVKYVIAIIVNGKSYEKNVLCMKLRYRLSYVDCSRVSLSFGEACVTSSFDESSTDEH